MITLIRPKNSTYADVIEDRLEHMIAAYKVEIEETKYPYLLENQKRISWKQVIDQYLDILEREISWTNSLSADACFIDPVSGTVC